MLTEQDLFMLRQIVRVEVQNAVKETVRAEMDDVLKTRMVEHAVRLFVATCKEDPSCFLDRIEIAVSRSVFLAAKDVREVAEAVGTKVARMLATACPEARR